MRTFYNTFPKSGTGLIHSIRGIGLHVTMFDNRGEFRRDDDYIRSILECDNCTGHVPFDRQICDVLKRNDYRIVFIFRNLRDVVCSLVEYVIKMDTELDAMVNGGVRLSRSLDPILDGIDVVSRWWGMFAGWMDHADAVYTYRELRGAALLLGHEDESATFAHGNINRWQKEFKAHHIEAAREKLPDVLKMYNFQGTYED